MEITNDNYKILHENTLKKKDIVKFTYDNITYTYEVEKNYLNHALAWNDTIFTVLQLHKQQVTTEAYGYLCGLGSWPECKYEDYTALTKLVIFLFEEIEKREHPETFIKSISNNPIKIKISIEPQIKIKLK